jgi:hypothetical protein
VTGGTGVTRGGGGTETASVEAHAFVRNRRYLVTSSTDSLVKSCALRNAHHLPNVAVGVGNGDGAATSANAGPRQGQVALAVPLPHPCLGPALASSRASARATRLYG